MKIRIKFIPVLVLACLLTGFVSQKSFFADNKEKSGITQVVDSSPESVTDQDRFVTMKAHDLKVHYRIIGNGSIDMVLIPGWTNPITVYTKQFDYFRDKARCIYIDLPGTGLSDAPTPNTPIAPIPDGLEYTMELMADAVYAVVKKEGIRRFVGVGFSMGPKVLGMFERNYPGMIYKLVVLDGGFNPWPADPDSRQKLIDDREGAYTFMLGWTQQVKEGMLGNLIPRDLEGEDAEELKEWGIYFPQFSSDILANTNYHSKAENANEPVGWMYPKLCFYSKSKADINMDKVNWIYPNNTVYGFPDGGHVIQWVFHDEINPKIWEFVKDRPEKKY